MTTKSVRGQTYLVILLSVVIPVLFFAGISLAYFSGALAEQSFARLETIREDRVLLIRHTISAIFHRMEILLPPVMEEAATLENNKIKDIHPELGHLSAAEPAIKGIYFFNDNFAYLTGIDRSGTAAETDVPSPLRLYLQSLIFDKPGMAGEVDMKDTTSQLVYFQKIVVDGTLIGYTATMLDYPYFDRYLEIKSPVHLRLYNNRYQIAGDNNRGKRWQVIITEHTERILDGFTENKIVDNRYHSYSFIDLIDTELFLDVSISEAEGVKQIGGFQITVIFYSIVLAMLAMVIGWSFGRSIIRYGESILINKSFNKDMSFFTRMNKNIRDLQGDIKTIVKVQTNLNYLRNDLSVILEEMPDENSESDKTE